MCAGYRGSIRVAVGVFCPDVTVVVTIAAVLLALSSVIPSSACAIINTGMLGTLLSMTLFGMSTTFAQAMVARFLGGFLNGNTGVCKVCVVCVHSAVNPRWMLIQTSPDGLIDLRSSQNLPPNRFFNQQPFYNHSGTPFGTSLSPLTSSPGIIGTVCIKDLESGTVCDESKNIEQGCP